MLPTRVCKSLQKYKMDRGFVTNHLLVLSNTSTTSVPGPPIATAASLHWLSVRIYSSGSVHSWNLFSFRVYIFLHVCFCPSKVYLEVRKKMFGWMSTRNVSRVDGMQMRGFRSRGWASKRRGETTPTNQHSWSRHTHRAIQYFLLASSCGGAR